MFRPFRERGGLKSLLSLFLLLFLVMPASAMSFRIDDPLTEVHYDVIDPNGSVFLSDQNETSISDLEADGHYTVILHTDPVRVVSDPMSFFDNMTQYGYAIIFGVFLVFLAGGIAGSFLSVFLRRR